MGEGNDPTKEIELLVNQGKSEIQLIQLSCGEKGKEFFIEQIRREENQEAWILLKNAHLSPEVSSNINKISNTLSHK